MLQLDDKIECIILNELAKEYEDYPVPLMYDDATLGNAGFDLRAFFKNPTVPNGNELTIYPGKTELIPTGLAIHIKDTGVAGMILPRSVLGHKHGIVVGNLVGLIDSTYQGEYMVSCWNRSDKPYTLTLGDRLAQLVFVPVLKPTFAIVDKFTDDTERGNTGFGDSGVS